MTLSPVCSKPIAAGACTSTARCAKPGPVVCAIAKHIKGKKLTSKPFWKGVKTFGKYGLQSTAFDFAYSTQEYFTGRTPWEHLGMFAAGGAAGVGTDQFFPGKNEKLNNSYKIAMGSGIFAAEWLITSRIKQGAYTSYKDYPSTGLYTGRSQIAKGLILGAKWFDQSYGLLFGQ